jgi:hypothetical protein
MQGFIEGDGIGMSPLTAVSATVRPSLHLGERVGQDGPGGVEVLRRPRRRQAITPQP